MRRALDNPQDKVVEPARPGASSIGRDDGVYLFGHHGVERRFDFGADVPLS